MTRDECIKQAWDEIFSSARLALEDVDLIQVSFSDRDWQDILDTAHVILRHPTEFTAWIE